MFRLNAEMVGTIRKVLCLSSEIHVLTFKPGFPMGIELNSYPDAKLRPAPIL